jgi:hypothetical protein
VLARQPVALEVHQQPLLDVQLGEAVGRHAQGPFDACRAQVVVQVDDRIEALGLQLLDQCAEVVLQFVHLVHVRIEAHQVGVLVLHREVQFHILQLLLQAAQHRAGEHDVTDGRESDDEQLHVERSAT